MEREEFIVKFNVLIKGVEALEYKSINELFEEITSVSLALDSFKEECLKDLFKKEPSSMVFHPLERKLLNELVNRPICEIKKFSTLQEIEIKRTIQWLKSKLDVEKSSPVHSICVCGHDYEEHTFIPDTVCNHLDCDCIKFKLGLKYDVKSSPVQNQENSICKNCGHKINFNNNPILGFSKGWNHTNTHYPDKQCGICSCNNPRTKTREFFSCSKF